MPPRAVSVASPIGRTVADDHVITGPLLGRDGAYLTVRDAAARVRLSLTTLPGLLYRVSTPTDSGLTPVATTRGGRVDLHFRDTGRRGKDEVTIVLNRTVRWNLALPTGSGEEQLDLRAGRVAGVSVGPSGLIEMQLPEASGTVPVTLAGSVGTAAITLAGSPARLDYRAHAGMIVTPWAVRLAPMGPESLGDRAWAGARNRYSIVAEGSLGTLTVKNPPR